MADSPKIPLLNKPGVTNWIEKYNVLEPKRTNWIRRAAEHLQGKGMMEGHAIAVAKNAAAKLCASGDLNWPGLQQANLTSRAEACEAIRRWEAGQAKARAAAATNLSAARALEVFAVIDLAKVKIGAKTIDLAPSTAERRQLAQKGKAMPGGRFPIRNHSDLKKAVRAVGRAKGDHAKVRRFIIRRAEQLGGTHLVPDHWMGPKAS